MNFGPGLSLEDMDDLFSQKSVRQRYIPVTRVAGLDGKLSNSSKDNVDNVEHVERA